MGNEASQPNRNRNEQRPRPIPRQQVQQANNPPSQRPNPRPNPRPSPKPQTGPNPDLLKQVAHPMQFVPPPKRDAMALMDRPQSTKGNLTDADMMNINQRMEEFKNSQKTEEKEFLQNLEKQKESFYEKQKSKQSQFEKELEDFELKYNPFRILHLDYNATEQDVKKAYRRFSLKYHPDKPGGNAKKFIMITQAYVYLLQKIKEMTGNKSHHEMQQDAKKYFEEMEEKRQEMKRQRDTEGNQIENGDDDVMEISSDKNFNPDKFNKIFEKNRMPSQWDKGYGGDWGEDDKEDDKVVMNKKFSMDLFNSMFEEQKKKKIEKKPERQIMIIDDPQPQLLSNLQFEELGQGDIEDFTSGHTNSMQFTDYKAAYTRANVLEYDEKFKRGDFKNLDHLVNERSKANFEMSNEDKQWLNKREMMIKKQEEERLQNMMAFDRMAEQYSQRANMCFIKNK